MSFASQSSQLWKAMATAAPLARGMITGNYLWVKGFGARRWLSGLCASK